MLAPPEPVAYVQSESTATTQTQNLKQDRPSPQSKQSRASGVNSSHPAPTRRRKMQPTTTYIHTWQSKRDETSHLTASTSAQTHRSRSTIDARERMRRGESEALQRPEAEGLAQARRKSKDAFILHTESTPWAAGEHGRKRERHGCTLQGAHESDVNNSDLLHLCMCVSGYGC